MKAVICKNKTIRKKLVIQAQKQGIETLCYLDIVESTTHEMFPRLKAIHEELTNA
jgi:hypothetical protein